MEAEECGPSTSKMAKKWGYVFTKDRHYLKIIRKSADKYVRVRMQSAKQDWSFDIIFDETYDVSKTPVIRLSAQQDFVRQHETRLVIRISEAQEVRRRRKCAITPISSKFLQLNKRRIGISKELLSLYSPGYFGHIFNSSFRESKQNVINIVEDQGEDFMSLLRAIERLHFNPVSVDECCTILDRAIFYQMESIVRKCKMYIHHNIDKDSALRVVVLANRIHDECLLNRSLSVFETHKEIVEMIEALKNELTKDAIIKILSMPRLPYDFHALNRSEPRVYLEFALGRVIIELDYADCPETSRFFLSMMKKGERNDRSLILSFCMRRGNFYVLSCNQELDLHATSDKVKSNHPSHKWGLKWNTVHTNRTIFRLTPNSHGDCFIGWVVEGEHILSIDMSIPNAFKDYGVVE